MDNKAPHLQISMLGIVSRDYCYTYPNGFRDFSYAFPGVLSLLDEEGCNAVLFSLFSIVPWDDFDPLKSLNGLQNIKAVLYEEFMDGNPRTQGRYVIWYKEGDTWHEYSFKQVFSRLKGLKPEIIQNFAKFEMPKRILGNICLLICGETNGVNYSRSTKLVHDTFGMKGAIPPETNIVLNPVHDKMKRPEMKLKRAFLSENERWVVSVWNRGKKSENGKLMDGKGPAWTVFYDGKEVTNRVQLIANSLDVEIGILDIGKTWPEKGIKEDEDEIDIPNIDADYDAYGWLTEADYYRRHGEASKDLFIPPMGKLPGEGKLPVAMITGTVNPEAPHSGGPAVGEGKGGYGGSICFARVGNIMADSQIAEFRVLKGKELE